MSSKFAIMKTSALPEKTKVSSLSNDLMRRMKNVSEDLDQKTRNGVVDAFAARLILSGYKQEQVRDIVIAGLKGYEKVVAMANEGKTVIHRSAAASAPSRYKKKLTGKSTWFLDKAECNKELSSPPRQGNPSHAKVTRPKCDQQESKQAGAEQKTVTVLFAIQTPNGELAARLRRAEQELAELCNNKVKIVERSGTTLKSLLVKTNPLGDQPCARRDCPLCSHEKQSKCKTRSVTYQNTCLLCKTRGVDKRYIGETARSGYERGLEHAKGYILKSEDNHMHKHHAIDHPDEARQPEFSMKVIKSHQSPLYRQIHEAIMIQKFESATLNSKGEYNRCQLPRLSVMMGEREMGKTKVDPERDHHDDEGYEDLENTETKRKLQPTRDTRRLKRRRMELHPGPSVAMDPSRNQLAAPTISKNDVSTPKRKRQQEGNPDSGLDATAKKPKHAHENLNFIPTKIVPKEMGTKSLIAYFETPEVKSNPSSAETDQIKKIHIEVNPPKPPSKIEGNKNFHFHHTLKPPPNHPTQRIAATNLKQRKRSPKLSPRIRKITTFFEKTKRERELSQEGEL